MSDLVKRLRGVDAIFRMPTALEREAANVIDELVEALKELTEAGEEAWGVERPCVRIGRAALARTLGDTP